MWTPNAFLDELAEKAALKANSNKAWTEKKKQLKQGLPRLLGEFAELDGDLAPCLLEKFEIGDISVERVVYRAGPQLEIPAYVLKRKDLSGRAPAIMAWHGHGYGSKEISGLLPDGTIDEAESGIHQHYALKLARKGAVVIAPEVVGFGERRLENDAAKDPRKNSSCQALAGRLLLVGKTLPGLRVREARRAVDYALTRNDVDPDRIGCIGFSGGGLIAAFSAAEDERIRAAVVCGFTNTFRGAIYSINHCIDNYVPSMMEFADLPEWMGLIAPRALFVESGENDPLFPQMTVREAERMLRSIYMEEGVPEQFEADIFPGKHEVSGRKSFDWLIRQLSSDAPQ